MLGSYALHDKERSYGVLDLYGRRELSASSARSRWAAEAFCPILRSSRFSHVMVVPLL
jgi:hypothetical protein